MASMPLSRELPKRRGRVAACLAWPRGRLVSGKRAGGEQYGVRVTRHQIGEELWQPRKASALLPAPHRQHHRPLRRHPSHRMLKIWRRAAPLGLHRGDGRPRAAILRSSRSCQQPRRCARMALRRVLTALQSSERSPHSTGLSHASLSSRWHVHSMAAVRGREPHPHPRFGTRVFLLPCRAESLISPSSRTSSPRSCLTSCRNRN